MRKKRQFMLTLIVSMAFLLGIMGYVSWKTYFNNRNNIIELSKMSAEEYAEKIDQFLMRQYDVMLTVTESVEYLRSEQKVSNEETKEYLVKISKEYEPLYETYADDEFIGIYGVFDGEYIDSKWIPPYGFDPTSRIWYRQALGSDGNICISEPYVDADDGDFIVTLSRKLNDGSVMGMDVDVRHIKNTIGTAMGLSLNINGDARISGFSFMMTKKGIVTMHMDAGEITKDYSDSESSLHGLYEKVMERDSSYFEVEINGEKCGVFPIELNNGWYYITVTNLNDLKQIFMDFISVIIFGTAGVLLFAMIYSFMINRANRQAEKLASELAQALEDSKIDQLTKLYNRVAYDIRLDELKKGLGTSADMSFALVMMDINDLKYVNDHFGHQEGDLYILNCCDWMKEIFGKDIYRLGGDEFAVIMTGEAYEHREQLYEKILKCGESALQYPIGKDHANIAAGMVCHIKGVKESIATIVNNADVAMYQNKEKMKRAQSH